MKKKLMQEILISQTKSHLIQSKQQNVRDMKAQKNELSKLYIRNIEVENRKHINSRQKVLVKQIINKKSKKELEEKKILELNRDINKKIEDNEKKKQSRIKNIEKLQKDELEILKKIRNCHQIHELALNEYSDLKTQSIINYEKKYRKPIKLEPIKTNIK